MLLTACGNMGAIARGEWQKTTAPVLVRGFGMNYQITTVVLVGDRPQPVMTLATDCQRTSGSLTVGDSFGDPRINDVYLHGNTPADKLFAYLCEKGIPIADSIESRMTAQEKYDRAQQTNQQIRMLNLIR